MDSIAANAKEARKKRSVNLSKQLESEIEELREQNMQLELRLNQLLNLTIGIAAIHSDSNEL